MAHVTVTFEIVGYNTEEAIDYLKTQVPWSGADAVADYINGDEEWTVDGIAIEIPGY